MHLGKNSQIMLPHANRQPIFNFRASTENAGSMGREESFDGMSGSTHRFARVKNAEHLRCPVFSAFAGMITGKSGKRDYLPCREAGEELSKL